VHGSLLPICIEHDSRGLDAIVAERECESIRAVVEIIIEERTGERDPEDRDGNLPDLETPNN
jgi:hypothetical protein